MPDIPPFQGPLPNGPDEYVGVDGPLFNRPGGPVTDLNTRRTVLDEALAGVPLGPYDEQMLKFLIGLGDEVTRALVSILIRSRDAGPIGRTVRSGNSEDGRDWITVAEICALLSISPREWQEWREEGPTPLHLVRDGQFVVRRSDFELWIEGLLPDLSAPETDSSEGRQEELAQVVSLEVLGIGLQPTQGSDLYGQDLAYPSKRAGQGLAHRSEDGGQDLAYRVDATAQDLRQGLDSD